MDQDLTVSLKLVACFLFYLLLLNHMLIVWLISGVFFWGGGGGGGGSGFFLYFAMICWVWLFKIVLYMYVQSWVIEKWNKSLCNQAIQSEVFLVK